MYISYLDIHLDIYIIALLLSVLLAVCLSKKYAATGIRGRRIVSRIQNVWQAFLVLLPLTLVLAFRWNVGVDSVYGESYSINYHWAGLGSNPREFEWGYYIFSAFFASMRLPFFWYLFIISLIYMICISYGIKMLSVSPVLSIATFVLMLTYFDAFSALRQALAQGICIIAMATWMSTERKGNDRLHDGLFLILIFIASLFHNIAIVYILFFFLCRKSYGQNRLLCISIIAVLLTPVINPILGLIFGKMFEGEYEAVGFASSYALFSLLILGLCIWRYYDILTINPRAAFLINHSLITFVLMLNSSALVLPFRIFDALKMCYIFTIPLIVKSFKNKKVALIISIALIAIMAVFYMNSIHCEGSDFAEYHSVFEDWDYITSLY